MVLSQSRHAPTHPRPPPRVQKHSQAAAGEGVSGPTRLCATLNPTGPHGEPGPGAQQGPLRRASGSLCHRKRPTATPGLSVPPRREALGRGRASRGFPRPHFCFLAVPPPGEGPASLRHPPAPRGPPAFPSGGVSLARRRELPLQERGGSPRPTRRPPPADRSAALGRPPGPRDGRGSEPSFSGLAPRPLGRLPRALPGSRAQRATEGSGGPAPG